MILKKNIIFSLNLILFSSSVNAGFNVVSYGWELFERVSDAKTVSLSYSTIAYPFGSNGTSIINPAIILKNNDKFGITHQSKIAGAVNSEFLSFKKKIRSDALIDISLLYEGISDIPDTRNVLLDWGEDGIFGTFDPGEGNGTLDNGERLDTDKIEYFSQKLSIEYLCSKFPVHRDFSHLDPSLSFKVSRIPRASSIHDEVSDKVFSVIVFVEPEHNIGTVLFDKDKNFNKVVTWKPNRAVVFAPIDNTTWHAFGNWERSDRYTIDFFWLREI